jgi:hypothetical protein
VKKMKQKKIKVYGTIGDGEREGGVLEDLQLLVDVGLGDEGVEDVEDTVHVPHVVVLLEQLDLVDDVGGRVLPFFDEFGAVLAKGLELAD